MASTPRASSVDASLKELKGAKKPTRPVLTPTEALLYAILVFYAVFLAPAIYLRVLVSIQARGAGAGAASEPAAAEPDVAALQEIFQSREFPFPTTS